jgi:hypothetical protein
LRTNRSAWAVYAASSTRARATCSWTAGRGGRRLRSSARPREWWCSSLYQWTKARQLAGVLDAVKPVGELGPVLQGS